MNPDVAPIVAGPLLGGTYEDSLRTRLALGQDLLSRDQNQSRQFEDIPGRKKLEIQLPSSVQAARDVIGNLLQDPAEVGPLDAKFPQENQDSLRKVPVPDGEIYLPFMFQDLRETGTAERFLYFRAFLKPGLAETFTPDWQVERYYGRVDQIPIYMGTLRSLSVAFDVVAWSPEDLPVMWQKLNKLQSMVYPFYNKGGFYKAGPIVRMRIGDLFAGADNKGLPGYITSLDWSYADGIWNIQDDFRVPRKVSVSLGYTVLHDGNPGTYPLKAADPSTIDFNKDVNGPTDSTQGSTFGAGKITEQDGQMKIKVSPSEIRKIFETVRNTSAQPGPPPNVPGTV
jgi:hypothetical protein